MILFPADLKYPNPAENLCTIRSDKRIDLIEIYDIKGIKTKEINGAKYASVEVLTLSVLNSKPLFHKKKVIPISKIPTYAAPNSFTGFSILSANSPNPDPRINPTEGL